MHRYLKFIYIVLYADDVNTHVIMCTVMYQAYLLLVLLIQLELLSWYYQQWSLHIREEELPSSSISQIIA